jgi:hypothetical protein
MLICFNFSWAEKYSVDNESTDTINSCGTSAMALAQAGVACQELTPLIPPTPVSPVTRLTPLEFCCSESEDACIRQLI